MPIKKGTPVEWKQGMPNRRPTRCRGRIFNPGYTIIATACCNKQPSPNSLIVAKLTDMGIGPYEWMTETSVHMGSTRTVKLKQTGQSIIYFYTQEAIGAADNDDSNQRRMVAFESALTLIADMATERLIEPTTFLFASDVGHEYDPGCRGRYRAMIRTFLNRLPRDFNVSVFSSKAKIFM